MSPAGRVTKVRPSRLFRGLNPSCPSARISLAEAEFAQGDFMEAEILFRAVADGSPWEVCGRGEKIEIDDAKRAEIGDLMMGAYFGLIGEILESGNVNVDVETRGDVRVYDGIHHADRAVGGKLH